MRNIEVTVKVTGEKYNFDDVLANAKKSLDSYRTAERNSKEIVNATVEKKFVEIARILEDLHADWLKIKDVFGCELSPMKVDYKYNIYIHRYYTIGFYESGIYIDGFTLDHWSKNPNAYEMIDENYGLVSNFNSLEIEKKIRDGMASYVERLLKSAEKDAKKWAGREEAILND